MFTKHVFLNFVLCRGQPPTTFGAPMIVYNIYIHITNFPIEFMIVSVGALLVIGSAGALLLQSRLRLYKACGSHPA